MSDERRVRAHIVRIVDRDGARGDGAPGGETTTVIGPTAARRFDGDSARLLRTVLDIYAVPRTRTELLAELRALAGDDIPEATIDELVQLLVGDGVLVASRPVAPAPAASSLRRRVVLGIAGAVAAVDAPALVRLLVASGCNVRVALTKTAKRFVSIAALESITHHRVSSGIWQRDPSTGDARSTRRSDRRAWVPHIDLAEWAELVLVCPATATTIARIATGDCSDLVSAIATATRAPIVIAPSMNDAMYRSPAVQDNLERLREHGRWIVHPAIGIEVAQHPDARTPMLGPAPPAPAIVDIVRHVLAQTPSLPIDAPGWERLWATTPANRLPWHGELEPALAEALRALATARTGGDTAAGGTGASLLDIGTGDGTVAIAAAHLGYRVTATDVSPSALGRARDRAGELPILFALDDATATRLAQQFDVVVDRGVLHGLPRSRWSAYARSIERLVSASGTFVVVAHAEPTVATSAIDKAELAALWPAFVVERALPTTLSNQPAAVFALRRAASQ